MSDKARAAMLLFRSMETWLNGVALAACWIAVVILPFAGFNNLAAGGPLPHGIQAAMAAATAGDAPARLVRWMWGITEITAAVVFALSAAEGSWWMARRLCRS